MDATGMAPAIAWGAAGLTLAGESESGDHYLVRPLMTGALVAVADGLGHGESAAAAARRALDAVASGDAFDLPALVLRAHEACRMTRGAALCVAAIDAQAHALTWMGVGNIEGLIVRADTSADPPRHWLLVRNGVVGYSLPTLRASTLPLAHDDTLIFATDGVSSRFADDLRATDSPQRVADHILGAFAKGGDDALVVVVRYRAGGHE